MIALCKTFIVFICPLTLKQYIRDPINDEEILCIDGSIHVTLKEMSVSRR